jgi:hypothetical protein
MSTEPISLSVVLRFGVDTAYTQATLGCACLRTSLGPRVSTLASSAGQVSTTESAGFTVVSL